MTTVHAYTNDQNVQDQPHKDPYRARAAALNIIPTTTGAAKAVGLVIPELKGKLTGIAMRVPVPTGSVVDLTVNLGKEADGGRHQRRHEEGGRRPAEGHPVLYRRPDRRTDIIGDPHSSIFAADWTQVLGKQGKLVKVVSWYDNEWGYSCRTADLCATVVQDAVGCQAADLSSIGPPVLARVRWVCWGLATERMGWLRAA